MSDEEGSSFQSGISAFRDKNYDEAIIQFSQAIEEKLDVHKAFNALGVTYSKIGKKKEAELCFKKALLLDLHNPTYEKNLWKVSSNKNLKPDQDSSKQNLRSTKDDLKRLQIIGILLGIVISIAILFAFILINFHSEVNLLQDNSQEGGLFLSFLHPLTYEERIYPVAEITLKDKQIEYMFDKQQDLSQITEIKAHAQVSDGKEVILPSIKNPQQGVYYGYDDPFYGKGKRFILSGIYKDNKVIVLADMELDPR